MKILSTFAILALAIGIPTATIANQHKTPERDIIDTAVAAGQFNTLAAALGAADLVDALKGDGPFTVFAPTDEAFAKLPGGTVEMLLKPENKEKLVDILTYHVVAAQVPAEVAVTLDQAEALNGKVIDLEVRGDSLFLNDSQVIKTDINTANGIIHVIDTVLLPPEMMTAQRMSREAEMLVGLAIDKGAPLYNHGNHAACAAVYELAAEALLLMPAGTMSDGQTMMLKSALNQVRHSSSPTDNAWTLRRAFDSMMAPMMENG